MQTPTPFNPTSILGSHLGFGRTLRRTRDQQSFDTFKVKPAFTVDPLISLEDTNIGKRVRLTKLRFLDLPPEVRMEIYHYFAHVPALDQRLVETGAPRDPDRERARRSKLLQSPQLAALEAEHRAMAQTRKSLLLPANRSAQDSSPSSTAPPMS
jgi:hypothetical protein